MRLTKKDKEILILSMEIIDDAESKKGSVEGLVYKAYRLAILVNNEHIKTWLNLEKYGYSDKEPDISYMKYTGRTFNEITRLGYWGSISTHENNISATLAELDFVKTFKPSGEYSMLQFNGQQQQIKNLNAALAIYKRICSLTTANIMDFATQIYYTYKFGEKVSSILEEYRKSTLDKIVKQFPDLRASFQIIDKIIFSPNPRGVSAAASEIRNIFINLSSKLYTSKINTYTCRDGQPIKTEKEKNKLIAYVDKKMGTSNEGKARAKKLFGIIHEVFTIGGKAKRKTEKNELSTILIDTFIFLNEIITYTDLVPIS